MKALLLAVIYVVIGLAVLFMGALAVTFLVLRVIVRE